MRIRKHITKGRNSWNMLVPALFICCFLISCSGKQEFDISKTGEGTCIDSLINDLSTLTYKNDWDW